MFCATFDCNKYLQIMRKCYFTIFILDFKYKRKIKFFLHWKFNSQHIIYLYHINNTKKRLRENKNFNGIKIKIDDKAHTINISQLADDTTLFVSSKTFIALAMNEIEIVGSFSGLILNRNTTEGIWIGKLKKNVKTKLEVLNGHRILSKH